MEIPYETIECGTTRQEWLAARRLAVGASDSAALLGLSPYSSPLHIYLEKIHELPDEQSDNMAWGLKLEEVVAHAYEEETGLPVLAPPAKILRSREWPWMQASLDRVVAGNDILPLECKTSGDAKEWGEPGTDEVPEYYMIQAQHQMAVAGCDRVDIAVLIRLSDFRIYTCHRNEAMIRDLSVATCDFWGMVERRQPPAPDWEHPRTVDLVSKMFTYEEDARINLGEEVLPIATDYLNLAEHIRALEKEKQNLKAILLYQMGGAGFATLPQGYSVVRKKVHKKAFSVKESEYFTLKVRKPKE